MFPPGFSQSEKILPILATTELAMVREVIAAKSLFGAPLFESFGLGPFSHSLQAIDTIEE